MNPRGLLFLIGCLVGGAAVGVFVSVRGGSAEGAAPARRSDDAALREARRTIEELTRQRDDYRRQLEERAVDLEQEKKTDAGEMAPAPEEEPAPEPPTPAAPPTEEEIGKAIESFGDRLQSIILGRKEGKEAAEQLRAVLGRAGDEAIRKLIDTFHDDATGIERRIVLAHALAQSHDPLAIEELKKTLEDPDAGLLEHRFASHGLAFSDAEGIDPILLEMARSAADRGVRANTAFGLNRRGVAEGMDLYLAATDEAFAKGDPAALQYLGGLTLMGERALPGMRRRLLTYTEEQASLTLISILRSKGDEGAIPNLEKIAYDSARPKSVQKAARAALEVLSQPKESDS